MRTKRTVRQVAAVDADAALEIDLVRYLEGVPYATEAQMSAYLEKTLAEVHAHRAYLSEGGLVTRVGSDDTDEPLWAITPRDRRRR